MIDFMPQEAYLESQQKNKFKRQEQTNASALRKKASRVTSPKFFDKRAERENKSRNGQRKSVAETTKENKLNNKDSRDTLVTNRKPPSNYPRSNSLAYSSIG